RHTQAALLIQRAAARTGSITAMKKIAAMADAHYVVIAPHNPNGPVCTAAAVHLAASIPNFVIMEEEHNNTKDYKQLFVGGWKPNLAEWTIPEAPGLGIDFSPQYL